MRKDLLLHIRYPYTSGIIAAMWIGTAFLAAIDRSAPIASMLILDSVATTIIAIIGFSDPRK